MSLWGIVTRGDFASNNLKEHAKGRVYAAFYIDVDGEEAEEPVFEDEVIVEYDNQYSFPAHLGPSGELATYDFEGPHEMLPYGHVGSIIEPGIAPYSATPLDLPTISNTELDLPSGYDYPYGGNLDYLTTRAWSRYPSSGTKVWLSNYFVGMHKVDLRSGFYVYERAGFKSTLSFPDCFETQFIGTYNQLDITTGLGTDWTDYVNNNPPLGDVNSWKSAWDNQDCHLLYGKAHVQAVGRFIAGAASGVIVDREYEFDLPDATADEDTFRTSESDPSNTLGSWGYEFGSTIPVTFLLSGRSTTTPFAGRRYFSEDDKIQYRGFDRLFAPMHFNYYHMYRRAEIPVNFGDKFPYEWDMMYPDLFFPPVVSYWGSGFGPITDAAFRQQEIEEHTASISYIPEDHPEDRPHFTSLTEGDYIPLQADLNRYTTSMSSLSAYRDTIYYYPLMHPGWDMFQLPIARAHTEVTAADLNGFFYSGMYWAFGVTNISYCYIPTNNGIEDIYSFQAPIALAPMMEDANIEYFHNPDKFGSENPDGHFFLTSI